MSDKREKLSILQTLTVSNLKEICEKNNLKGYSGTKKELAKFMVDNLEISLEELKDICNVYLIDKLLGKIRDCRDHFLNKRVTIRCRDKNSPIVDVGGHRVIINNLEKEFVNILKETSFSQVKNSELKEDLLKMLNVK